MSAFKRLWYRAPLWCTALLLACLCTPLSLIFPAPWLVRIAPPYQILTSKISHFLGTDTPSDQQDKNSSDVTNQADQDNQTDQAETSHTGTSEAPFDAELSNFIPFAGRQLPLPAGKWHPLLNQQTDQGDDKILSLSAILVRVNQGLVTGLIFTTATTQPASPADAQQLTDMCNSGYNFMTGSLPQDGNQTECWMTTPVRVLKNSFMTSNQPLQNLLSAPLLSFALDRLTQMDIVLPPSMVDTGWVHIEKAKVGTGVDIEVVHILTSPAVPGQRTFPGAPEDWTRTGIQNSPAAASFVDKTNTWFVKWLPYLRQGYAGTLENTSIPQNIAIDPGYHG